MEPADNCKSCGDPIDLVDIPKTKGWCRECHDEIHYGKIPEVKESEPRLKPLTSINLSYLVDELDDDDIDGDRHGRAT
jgi:hypothetical protein